MAQAGGSVPKQWQLSNAGCAAGEKKSSHHMCMCYMYNMYMHMYMCMYMHM